MTARRPMTPDDPRHGTTTGYKLCKCAPCREANAEYKRARRAAVPALPEGDPRHGTRNGYVEYRCHCRACTDAHVRFGREYRRRMKTRGPVNPIVAGDGDPRHGTTNGYAYHRCRCVLCNDANTQANRDYLDRRKQQAS